MFNFYIHRENFVFIKKIKLLLQFLKKKQINQFAMNELKNYKNNSTVLMLHMKIRPMKNLFLNQIYFNSKLISSGIGSTKKNAEQNAASNAIPILTEQYEKICKESNSPPPPPRPTSIRVHTGEIPTDETPNGNVC